MVHMPLWICLFRRPAASYQFHTILWGRQCQPEGSKSSFGFAEGANQKPQCAHAHLTKHCQGHGTESHVYTAPLLRHSILNLPCSRRVGIQNTHMGSARKYQKRNCDLVLSRAQMYFQSDCKSQQLSQEVMGVLAPMDIAQLVANSLCPSSVDEQRTARRQLYARRCRKTQHKSLQISCGVQLAPLFS